MMNHKHLFRFHTLLLSLTLIGFQTPSQAATQDHPIVESIEGDKIVVVRNAQGTARVAAAGSEINFGDRVKTGPRASAKIRYPDGSKMLIGRGTELTVLESKDGVQYNELKAGEIRGVIRRPKGLPAGSPPRFVVRSQSAVMGVRGTDFVFDVAEASQKAQVHTLDGTVDVAKDEATLMRGEGVPVTKDQMIDADGKTLSKPQSFDPGAFMEQMNQSQPEFAPLTRGDSDMVSKEGAEPQKPAGDPIFRIFSFQLNPVYIQQKTGGKLGTFELSWNPTLNLPGPLYLRLHLGGFPLKGRGNSGRFFAVEGGGLLVVQIWSFFVEGGPGAEIWSGGNSKLGGLVMANLGWRFSGDRFIDRIFIGGSVFDYKPNVAYVGKIATAQIKAGIGIHF